MPKHEDYVTHIKNGEDIIYLRSTHFPVNMRLFNTSAQYRVIIMSICKYMEWCCLTKMEGYKKPHGMSSANIGMSFNIIAICMNRGTKDEYAKIMINPEIGQYLGEEVETTSNCGSLTLPEPITIKRNTKVRVEYFNTDGEYHIEVFDREHGAFTIQHEVDHNNGTLIIDY